jgi:hypothetical protein
MKKVLLLLLLSIMIMGTNSLSAQNKTKNTILPGSWMGKLSADGMDLRVVFNLKLAGDSLTVTLDSPDQGAKDIPAGPVIVDNKKIVIQAPGINGEYNGTLTGDSTIDGTWTQNGGSLPLNLKKQKLQ